MTKLSPDGLFMPGRITVSAQCLASLLPKQMSWPSFLSLPCVCGREAVYMTPGKPVSSSFPAVQFFPEL